MDRGEDCDDLGIQRIDPLSSGGSVCRILGGIVGVEPGSPIMISAASGSLLSGLSSNASAAVLTASSRGRGPAGLEAHGPAHRRGGRVERGEGRDLGRRQLETSLREGPNDPCRAGPELKPEVLVRGEPPDDPFEALAISYKYLDTLKL